MGKKLVNIAIVVMDLVFVVVMILLLAFACFAQPGPVPANKMSIVDRISSMQSSLKQSNERLNALHEQMSDLQSQQEAIQAKITLVAQDIHTMELFSEKLQSRLDTYAEVREDVLTAEAIQASTKEN